MKICLYTISNFSIGAISCINLLLKSLSYNNYSDFFIISNYIDNSCPYNIILDTKNNSNYIGYLKYSPNIPKGYDYYIYLDSDILYFDSLESLISPDKSFSVVKENCLIKENKDWFYFKHIHSTYEEKLIENCSALNAGSFAFNSEQINNIQSVYYYYQKYKNNDIMHNAQLEQSIYNFIIHRQTKYSLDNCYDLTDKTLLFASQKQQEQTKKLYHFCGFSNEMLSKYKNMKNFYDNYIR